MVRAEEAPPSMSGDDLELVAAAAAARRAYDDFCGRRPVTLAVDPGVDVPPGWLVVIRGWGPDLFDAVIYSGSCPCVCWRLPDPFARSASEAIGRVRVEVLDHLRRCPKPGYVQPPEAVHPDMV